MTRSRVDLSSRRPRMTRAVKTRVFPLPGHAVTTTFPSYSTADCCSPFNRIMLFGTHQHTGKTTTNHPLVPLHGTASRTQLVLVSLWFLKTEAPWPKHHPALGPRP